MKRTKDKIIRTPDDRPCNTCANTFRNCPMDLALALSRMPVGMEVAVLKCPEYKKREDA